MKKHIAVLILCLVSLTSLPQTTIVSYNFDACSTTPSYTLPGFSATPVTTTSTLTTGCSLGCATGCGPNAICSINTALITEAWNSVGINLTRYCEFTLSTAPGISFFLNQFSFHYRRSSTGPTNFSLAVNGVQKGSGSLSGTGCNPFGVGINQTYTTSTTFRIYFWGGALDGTLRLDNVSVTHSSTTLPIELIYFDAKTNHNAVDLLWITASEINSSHYEVERSLDGLDYQEIAKIDAAGNSQTNTTYFYTDYNQSDIAVIYYRLKQVDHDQQFSYSPTVAVTSKLSEVVNTHGVLSFRNRELYDKAAVYDVSGKMIHNLILGNVKLDSGVYFVQLSKDGISSMQTIYIR